jgi:hypothetical protein
MNTNNKNTETEQCTIPSVVRSIFKEMKWDEKSINKGDRHTKEFREGFSEAVRSLAIIIKQESEVDVRK